MARPDRTLSIVLLAALGALLSLAPEAAADWPLEIQLDDAHFDRYPDEPLVVTGRVVANDSANATFAPVAAAQAAFVWLNASGAPGANNTTDNDGRFRFALVGPSKAGALNAFVRVFVPWAGRSVPPVNLTVTISPDASPRQLHVVVPYLPGEITGYEEVEIHGYVTKSALRGWNATAATGVGVWVRLGDEDPGQEVATTDEGGNFHFNFSARAAPGSQVLEVEARDGSGGLEPGTAAFNFTLLPPAGLMLVVDTDSLHFAPAEREAFNVRGAVFYTNQFGAATDPAPNVLVRVAFVNPFQPDLPSAGRTDGQGRFNITVAGRSVHGTYAMNVLAHDPVTELDALPVGVTAVVSPPRADVGGTTVPGDFPTLVVAGLVVTALALSRGGRRTQPPLTPR